MTTTTTLLRTLAAEEVRRAPAGGIDDATSSAAAEIIADVRARGEPALRHHAERFGDIRPGAPLIASRDELRAALNRIDRTAREALESAADRIHRFAVAQRACLKDLEIDVPGGTAGHRFIPAASAGCYAPGGRYPLPSSILMTVITARAAGVPIVWAASPRAPDVTLAAAAIADADGLLLAGGAQAIAALAYGAGPVPPSSIVVGPGNRFVTAAKRLISADVGIDMLAGPSEILIIADDSADPTLIAADMLAQAEHDDDASAVLITTCAPLVEAVERALMAPLEILPSAPTARAALRHSFAVVARDLDHACELADRLAPEHVELMTRDDAHLAEQLREYGGLFIGPAAAEVAGDYGAGPNHVLPTGGCAAYASGLSVLTFLRQRSFLRLTPGPAAGLLCRQSAILARIEGLEGHARAAEVRVHR